MPRAISSLPSSSRRPARASRRIHAHRRRSAFMDPRDAACAAPEDDGWKSMWRGLPLAGKAKGPGSPRSWGWSRRFGAAEHGATALEFAILAPAFLAIVFGIINLGIGLFGIATMHA